MKTLAVARPLVLVLVGLPGAGKSFFARQFSEMFSTPLVSYDRLQYELFASPQHTPQEQEIVSRLAIYMIEQLLKTKRGFIIDGGSASRAERLTIEKLAKGSGYDTLLIWVQTDDTTAKVRSLKRNPKRADDQFVPQLNEEQFVMYTKRYAAPAQENHVVISGKHAFSTQAKMVLRRLSAPHAEQAQAAHKQEKPPERILRPAARPDAPPTGRRVIIS